MKGQPMLKKRCKRYQNRPINRDTTPVESMSRLNEQRAGLGAWQNNKQKTYKHLDFALQPARITSNLKLRWNFAQPSGLTCPSALPSFPKLCMVIQHVETIRNV